MGERLRNPSVGPRPFEPGEKLYGRDREERELFHKLKARRIVLLHSPDGSVKHAAWSGDARRVLTASYDNAARIWDAETGQVIHKLEGHADSVVQAAWSGDARRVLTASSDGTARIWAVGGTQHLQGRIRAGIRDLARRCLPADFRQLTLGEPPEEAERHVAACEACVPGFFERLEGVSRGEVDPYVEAWREYRACLDERLLALATPHEDL